MYKMIEVVGSSTENFSKAVQNAIEQIGHTKERASWFEVIEQRGSVQNGCLNEFQIKLKVAVIIPEPESQAKAKPSHFCPTCHQNTEEAHLCVPVSKKDRKCDWCGALIVSERHLCQDKIQDLTYVCNSCGRTAVKAEHLCHPERIK